MLESLATNSQIWASRTTYPVGSLVSAESNSKGNPLPCCVVRVVLLRHLREL